MLFLRTPEKRRNFGHNIVYNIIETKIAAQYGISRFMLYKLCKENKIHRIVKGQYVLPEDIQDELFSINKRSEKIIFSHETALFLHGISDRTPFEHTVPSTNESLGITTIPRLFSLLYDSDLLGSIPIFFVGYLLVATKILQNLSFKALK